MTTFRQRIQKDINDLIKSLSETKGMILTYPLLVEFFDGDHNAAIFTNQILYWTERTTDPDGWFYKTYDEWETELQFSYYQVQRVIFGDERVQNPKRNLSDIGLETKVKMAPNGRNATYYRLDVPQFMGMFLDWLEQKFGDITTKVKSFIKPKVEPDPVPDLTEDDDLFPPLWFRQEPEIIPTERVQMDWENKYNPGQTIADSWKITHSQLEIQFDRASFETYLKQVRLVDYDPSTYTFTLTGERQYQVDMLTHRLNRNVRRVLSDVFGHEVTVVFVTYDEWRDRHR